MKLGDSQYRQLCRCYAELARRDMAQGLTVEEGAEMRRISDAMAAAEMAHRAQQSTIALVASDYEQLRQMGDLGGVEL